MINATGKRISTTLFTCFANDFGAFDCHPI